MVLAIPDTHDKGNPVGYYIIYVTYILYTCKKGELSSFFTHIINPGFLDDSFLEIFS